jgi:gluconokinase
MHSVLAVDKNGNPLGNAITWSDNRAKKEADKLKTSALGKTIYTATGTPLASYVSVDENSLDKK